MSIEIKCPRCQYVFRRPDTFAGLLEKCPECRTVLRMPMVASSQRDGATPPLRSLTSQQHSPENLEHLQAPRVERPESPSLARTGPADANNVIPTSNSGTYSHPAQENIHYHQGYLYCYHNRADANDDFGLICDLIGNAKSSGEQAAEFGYDVVLVSTTAHYKQAILVTSNDPSLTINANAVIKQICRHGDKPMKYDEVEGMFPTKVNSFFQEEGAQVLACRHFPPGVEAGTCFFCGLHESHDDTVMEVSMHGDVERQCDGLDFMKYRMTWKHIRVRIPRCRQCKENHTRIMWWTVGGGFAGSFVAFGVGCVIIAALALLGRPFFASHKDLMSFLASPIALPTIFISSCGLAAYLGNWIGRTRVPYDIKPASRWVEFRRIRDLKAAGWKMGEKPPGA